MRQAAQRATVDTAESKAVILVLRDRLEREGDVESLSGAAPWRNVQSKSSWHLLGGASHIAGLRAQLMHITEPRQATPTVRELAERLRLAEIRAAAALTVQTALVEHLNALMAELREYRSEDRAVTDLQKQILGWVDDEPPGHGPSSVSDELIRSMSEEYD